MNHSRHQLAVPSLDSRKQNEGKKSNIALCDFVKLLIGLRLCGNWGTWRMEDKSRVINGSFTCHLGKRTISNTICHVCSLWANDPRWLKYDVTEIWSKWPTESLEDAYDVIEGVPSNNWRLWQSAENSSLTLWPSLLVVEPLGGVVSLFFSNLV